MDGCRCPLQYLQDNKKHKLYYRLYQDTLGSVCILKESFVLLGYKVGVVSEQRMKVMQQMEKWIFDGKEALQSVN